MRANLIELILKDRKGFSREDFTAIGTICWRVSKSLVQEGNIHAAIDMLRLGQTVDQRVGKKTHNWERKIAQSFETLMRNAEQTNNLASLAFCEHALESYKKLNERDKIAELERKYLGLKSSIKLKEFKTEIDLSDHIKRCKAHAEKIVQKQPNEIIELLMLHKDILPKYKDVEKISIEQAKRFISQSLFPTVLMDENGNPTQHFSTEDEKKYHGMLQAYDWEIKLNRIYLINEIFFAAIRENKLSTSILMEFFRKHSWFGKNISRKLPNDKVVEYNWLNLVAPALNEYFIQMGYFFLNPIAYPNLVLSIDSLTLKIEGLIRDICRFCGVTTFFMTKDTKRRNIIREKDIHGLLFEELIKKLFDEDDLLFFRFLLVEKAGLNLRHKVAHSLMLFQEYSVNYMNLLILALLKLGRYDFEEKDKGPRQPSEEGVSKRGVRKKG